MNEGEVISGRYVLGALLGSGGMGRVHVAQDRKLAREVAVKLLVSAAPEPETLRRFQREALAAGSLQHPNIVAVFDAGDEAGRPFIVTELLRGSTLRARLADGPLPAPEAARIARQIAAGLSAAHEKGLVHRDLKPENIFITQDGWVKLLDFGLVKLTEALTGDAPPEGTTGAGRIIGTVGYMAPEQVRGRPVDARADLFNFGLVLYEMLSGQRAFKAGSPTETGYATLHREPPLLAKSVPSGLRALVSKTLQKDPAQRIGSAREIVEQLDKTSSAPSRPRVPLRLLAAVGAALLVAALVGVGLERKRAEPALPAIAAGTAPASGTVAVLPFTARDAPQFTWLSEGIVDLLARDFEGSDLRAVDSASVLRAVGGEATADIDKVRGASARLGAKYFVLGRIEQRKGQLVLEAVLHTGDAGVPVAEAVAQGDPAELLTLVRKLSDQLQSRTRTPQEFDARLASLVRRTSRSPQALQAWLEGEQLLRRGHWPEVISLFQKAASADPSFALAQYRLGVVADIREPGIAEDALQRALQNVDRLSAPEQLLLPGRLAMQQGRFGDAESAFRAATRKYPDDPQTWLELGELLFHENALRVRSPQEAEGPLEHALILEPLNTEAISHLVDLAVLRGERAVAAKIAERLLALIDDPGWLVNTRVTLSWALSDARERQNLISELTGTDTSRAVTTFAFGRAAWLHDFDLAGRIAAGLAASPAPEARASGEQLNSLLDLMEARPDAARTAMHAALQLDPSETTRYRAVWIETLDFFPPSAGRLSWARGAADALDVAGVPYLLPRKIWLAGLVAIRAGDVPGAEKAAAALERMPPLDASSITGDLALSLRARLVATHDPARALALLEQQQLRVPVRYMDYYRRMNENLLRGQLLTQLGRTREALQAFDAFDIYMGADPVFLPMAHLGKARAMEKAGDGDGAIQEYATFVELWKSCEPALRGDVESAQTRIEQLKAAQRASR